MGQGTIINYIKYTFEDLILNQPVREIFKIAIPFMDYAMLIKFTDTLFL